MQIVTINAEPTARLPICKIIHADKTQPKRASVRFLTLLRL
jgi:hypothetical protein